MRKSNRQLALMNEGYRSQVLRDFSGGAIHCVFPAWEEWQVPFILVPLRWTDDVSVKLSASMYISREIVNSADDLRMTADEQGGQCNPSDPSNRREFWY